MGELGANFCRNDFLKSKLNEMDFKLNNAVNFIVIIYGFYLSNYNEIH